MARTNRQKSQSRRPHPVARPRLAADGEVAMRTQTPDRPYNVLFLCTGNSARSILAESILTKVGEGKFKAFSAGSFPKADVNPLALETLRDLDYPTDGLRSKSWDEFAKPN